MKRITTLICIFSLHFSTVTFAQKLCIPKNTSGAPSSNYIQNFAFGDILNRKSEANAIAYVSYPEASFTTKISLGATYPVTVSHPASAGTTAGFAMWIDFNNDSTFSTDEKVFTGNGYYASGLVTIPSNPAFLGKRILRIKSNWWGVTNACSHETEDGETEDYVVTITAEPKNSLYYCVPFDEDNDDVIVINTVTLNTLKNSNSGSNAFNYSVYSEQDFTTTLQQSGTYTITVNTGQGAGITANLCAWIDYNNNQLFDTDEMILPAKSGYVNSAAFTVPATAPLGKHRLRARSSWRTGNDPCGFGSNIETEDYTITIGKVTSLSMSEFNDAEELLRIFPNPGQDQVTIQTTSGSTSPFKMKDSFGKVVRTGLVEGSLTLLLSDLAPGVYYIELDGLDKKFTSRFVKIN